MVEDARPAGVRAGGRLHPPGGRRAGPRPRPQHGPLRHQALEPAGEPAGHRQDPRHGHGPAQRPERGGQRRQRRARARHGRLPVARTGHEEPRLRPPGRHLLAGVHLLLPADRQASLRRRDAPRADPQAPDQAAAEHRRAAPGHAQGPGGHLPQDDGQEARRPLPVGRGSEPAVERLAPAQAQAAPRHAAGRDCSRRPTRGLPAINIATDGASSSGVRPAVAASRGERGLRRAQSHAALADPRRRGRWGGPRGVDPGPGAALFRGRE